MNHLRMVREAKREAEEPPGGPRKRRRHRERAEEPVKVEDPVEVVEVLLGTDAKSSDDEFDDIWDGGADEKKAIGGAGSDDDDDFEDVDLDANNEGGPVEHGETSPEMLVIPIAAPEPAPAKRVKVISKEERHWRRFYHMAYLVCMVGVGLRRNQWANLKATQDALALAVSQQTYELLHPLSIDPQMLGIVKSRKYLDGLKRAMGVFHKKYKVAFQGLLLKHWGELSEMQRGCHREPIGYKEWHTMVTEFRGSRDMGAQAFCAMLRGLGVRARLVLSIQAPDYTIITPADTVKPKPRAEKPKPSTVMQRFGSKQQLLEKVRSEPAETSTEEPLVTFTDSPFPVWWVEAWDKYARKWVAIDPVVLNHMEVPPMRRRSKFEPPTSEHRNQLHYAIAFDAKGRAKDVTRRYCFLYNAKTQRKRIGQFSDEAHEWYLKLLRSVAGPKPTQLDALERKEFHDRDLAEGMPNNMADFKNHPLYALESQIRANEVLDPKTKVGSFRPKLKKEALIPVYRRSSVKQVKLAKAWWMLGRQLKVGVQPLKVRPSKEDPEDDERLYAEYQTEMYYPPDIVDGEIPKNTFGNIDCYVPLMIPSNGYLIPEEDYPLKLAERAARIIGVDYARAVVGFSFKGRANVKAKEGGVVIDAQYREAMEAVMDCLIEEEVEQVRREKELQSLKLWKFFITKLRLGERLDRVHGEVEDDDEFGEGGFIGEDDEFEGEGGFVGDDDGDSDASFVVESDGSGPDIDERRPFTTESPEAGFFHDEPAGGLDERDGDEGGGFMVEDEGGGFVQDDEGGGFVVDDEEDGVVDDEGGGFIVDDDEGGGFIVDDDEGGGFVDEEGGGFVPGTEETDESKSGKHTAVGTGPGGPGLHGFESARSQTPHSGLNSVGFRPGSELMEAVGRPRDSPAVALSMGDADEIALLTMLDNMFHFNDDGDLIYDPVEQPEQLHVPPKPPLAAPVPKKPLAVAVDSPAPTPPKPLVQELPSPTPISEPDPLISPEEARRISEEEEELGFEYESE